jgi:hypothetical protein
MTMKHLGPWLAALMLAAVPSDGLATGTAAKRAGESPASRPEASQPERAGRQILVTIAQSAQGQIPRAGTSRKAYGPARRYRASQRARRTAARLAAEYGLREVAAWPIELLGVHCVVYEVPEEATAGKVLERLARDPRVESAQPMQLFEVLAAGYNDPYFELQVGARALQIEEAHRWALGRGVRVAVVDTGVDVEHPELAGRVVVAEDFVGDGAARFTSDVHGTAVAGIIAAAANNGLGGVGVAPGVELLAFKACWQEQAASPRAVCNSFTLAEALSFAVARRAQVVNLSLTGPPDPLLARLIGAAVAEGVVVVAAAAPEDGGEPAFPASLAGVVAVRAAGPAGEAQAPRRAGLPLALAAPGEDVLAPMPHGAFDFVSGSSFAAAQVSGIAALLLERDRKLAPAEVYALLERSSRRLAAGDDPAAVVNACLALAELTARGTCPPLEPAHRSTSLD